MNNNIDIIRHKAEELTKLAKACGVVLTIETKPLKPYAMGNHEMAIEVRAERIMAVRHLPADDTEGGAA